MLGKVWDLMIALDVICPGTRTPRCRRIHPPVRMHVRVKVFDYEASSVPSCLLTNVSGCGSNICRGRDDLGCGGTGEIYDGSLP